MSAREDRRVLSLFIPSLNGGGAQQVFLTLAGEWAQRGHRVDLVVGQAQGEYAGSVPPAVRLVDLGVSRMLRAVGPLVRYVRQERPCALIATLPHANVLSVAVVRGASPATRVFVRAANTASYSLKSLGLKGHLLRMMMRLTYPHADGVIAVSRGVAEDLGRLLSLPQERIRVIPNPVRGSEWRLRASDSISCDWFHRSPAPLVLGVGRLTAQKDFPTLIRAFARVREQREARLAILGEGEDRPMLQDLVRDLGLEEDVRIPGFVQNPYKWMGRASVFVLSSVWEGFPNVLVQAMACGCPVVSTDCKSGPREILKDGELGRLIPVGDARAMAGGIEEALDGLIDAGALQQRADDFCATAVAEQYLELVTGSHTRGVA